RSWQAEGARRPAAPAGSGGRPWRGAPSRRPPSPRGRPPPARRGPGRGAGGRGRGRVGRAVRREPQGIEDPPSQLVAQTRTRRLLDEQPEDDVVAAGVEPPLSRRREPRPGLEEPGRGAGRPLRAVRRVLSIRLQELVELDAVRKAARVIEQLAHRYAALDQTDVAVELDGA